MAGEFPRLRIGGDGDDRLEIAVVCRAQGDVEDFDDGNWLSARVHVRAGGFRGETVATLRAEELRAFAGELRELSRTLRGRAALETMEEWLAVALDGDGLGHIEVTGFVRDALGPANRLEFRFALDQTYLRPVLRGLDEVASAFPVVG